MRLNELKLQRSSFTMPIDEWRKLTEEQQNDLAMIAFQTDREMGTAVDVDWNDLTKGL